MKKNNMLCTDDKFALAMWYEGLRATTNETFMPLYAEEARYLVLMGGGGSGKSIFAGRKLIERCLAEAGHRFLVCRQVARTLRESCFRQITSQLAELYPTVKTEQNQSDMRITFSNGSLIVFTGLDDTEKLKSIYGITGVWIEEASEVSETDFNQLDIRLRGESEFYKQIILTFNPVSLLHWLKRRFFDGYDSRVRTHKSTYRDNRFLDREAGEVLEGFKDTDPYYYNVYCLGEWGVSGRSVFSAGELSCRLASLPPPAMTGFFDIEGDFIPAESGTVKIYLPPRAGGRYVIGCDTAGEGSDFFCAQVLDVGSGAEVAVLRQRTDEDVFVAQLYRLGLFYGSAVIAVETNFSTYAVRELERLRYPNQYVRESFDDYTHELRRSFGFRTDRITRPVILSGLISVMRGNSGLVNDAETLREMLTFVRGEDLRIAAESGAHDDCVMALAIAHFVRRDIPALKPASSMTSWTSDMLEDYRRAAPDEKKYLLEKWKPPDA